MTMKQIEKVTDRIEKKAFDIDFLKAHTWNQEAWKKIFSESDKGKKFAQTVIWGLFLVDFGVI